MSPRTPELQCTLLADPESATGISWEETACPLCNAEHFEARFESADPTATKDPLTLAGRDYRFLIVQCRSCGLMYTNPRPDSTCIHRFYPTDYKPHRRPAKLAKAAPRSRSWRHWLGYHCRERRGILPWCGTGRLLDFGCGGGSYLKRMADLGWQVVGLDAAVGAVRRVQEELGLSALVGSLPHPQLTPQSFEIVTMWHSLEHVHAPLRVLREAYRLLVPGGKLIVATPNIESWAFRRFGPAWFGLDVPRHLTHFSPATLMTALQTAGLRVTHIRPLRHSDWLRSSARLARRVLPWSGWTDRLLTWKPAAKLTAWVAHAAQQSDCMLAIAERPNV